MNRAVWVLPSIDPAYRKACLETMSPSVRDRTLVVDNTVTNCGVAASWNLGALEMEIEGADWLVVCSESMRFGPPGGADFEAALTGTWTDSLFGWHLVAFHRATLQAVGRFDENFWPSYLEDSDYLVRMHLAGIASPRLNQLDHTWVTGVDAHHEGTEHSLREGLVSIDWPSLISYYTRKWGAEPPEHRYLTPFNRPDKTCAWWPAVREPR